jgi:hypothetical protein
MDEESENREVLLGIQRPEKWSKWSRAIDKNYNPYAPKIHEDKVGYGALTDRIGAVKSKYSDLSGTQIVDIIKLGRAPRRPRNRRTVAENDALKTIAAKHYVKIVPELNSAEAFKIYKQRKIEEAIRHGDARAAQYWNDMEMAEEDWDCLPETPENLIVRNSRNPSDVYAIDGLRLVQRDNAMIKRGVYDKYPSVPERKNNREFINQLYKKCLRKFTTKKAREVHPFEDVADDLIRETANRESVFSRVKKAISEVLANGVLRSRIQMVALRWPPQTGEH